MSSYENLLFDELDDLLRKLSYLCLESKRFVEQLFNEMGNAVSRREIEIKTNLNQFIEDYKNRHSKFKVRVENLEVKLSRKNFQIFIYGQVSVGKSKIINAILREDIFKSAPDHTTSCFVQICKSSDKLHHIKYRNINKSYAQLNELINEIRNLSTTNSVIQIQLETNELLSVYLNIPDNKILTLNTEIIDCPGSANEQSITNFIKERGLQADVFILVLTSEITENEMEYFANLSVQSSNPIIFFLINKWDQAYNDGDDVAEKSKRTITNGINRFLGNRLRLSEHEINNRIFFVSALEMCRYQQNGRANSNNIDEHVAERRMEFNNFEEALSQCHQSNLSIRQTYLETLREIKRNVIGDINHFKIEFRRKINNEYIGELKMFLTNIRTSLERQAIENRIINLKTNLMSFVNKCEKNIDRYQIPLLDKEFNELINRQLVLEIKIEIESVIDDQIQNYEEVTDIHIIKDRHELQEAMKMEIKLKAISDTTWEWFCNEFTKIFTILRNHFKKNLKEKDDEILKKNVKEIKKVTNNVCTESLDPLSRYLATETKKITNLLELKIQAYETFLTNINNLFTT